MVAAKRQMAWVNRVTGFAALASGSQTNLLLFSDATFGGLHSVGATVTRLLIKLWMRPAAVAQVNYLDWGIVMVNADARAAGAFPDADDPDDRAGWIVRDRLVSMVSSVSDSSQWALAQLDVRGQRVLRSEQSELHLILDSSSSFSLDWAAYIRILLRMPA